MKKLAVVLVSALAAGLFFGCSDSSDSNNMGLLLASGGSQNNGGSEQDNSTSQTGFSGKLPASVGENPFAGKSFIKKYDSGSTETFTFYENYYTRTADSKYEETETADAYSSRLVMTCPSYTYNTNTKTIYTSNLYQMSVFYIIRDDKQIEILPTTYLSKPLNSESEEEFLANKKEYIKLINNKITDEATINQMANEELYNFRKNTLTSYGYTDPTGKAPASKEVYDKYYEGLANSTTSLEVVRKLINPIAYDFIDGDLKLYKDKSGALPKGIKFGELYNGMYPLEADITNESLGGKIGKIYIGNITASSSYNYVPEIYIGDGYSNLCFKISSATDESITGEFMRRTGNGTKDDPYVYTENTPNVITLSYETSETKSIVTMQSISFEGKLTTLGTFEIPYEASLNSYTIYTKN